MNFEVIINDKKLMSDIKFLCKGYYNTSVIKYSMEYEDYYQEQMINIYTSLSSYDNKKSSPITYIKRCIKNKHINMCVSSSMVKNQINNIQNKYYIDAEVCEGEDSYNILMGESDVNVSIEFLKETYKDLLTEEEYKIVDLLLMGFNQRQITEIMEFEKQQIKYKMKKIREKLMFLVTN